MRIAHKKFKLTTAKQTFLRSREEYLSKRKMRKIRKQIKKGRGQHRWYQRTGLLTILRHILPLFILLVGFQSLDSHAQTLEQVFQEDTNIDSIPVGSLRAEVDASAFFHDNEYSSSIQNGYTLPGTRITPHLAYNPLRQVNIEVGATMLFYHGANKYPCYAYHDISTWKGNQYQPGCHALPWVRLQASFKHVNLVFGNIYGASNHQLLTPLYNAEQNLSADPETGFQILVKRKHFQSDTWINWQSYIFEEDSHQEAFTVGESMRLLWGKISDKWQLYTPLQVIIHHRGGEQDTTSLGVQTVNNASLGLAIQGTPILPHIDSFDAQINALFCYQQTGSLWPFDTGCAFHVGWKMGIFKNLHLSSDYQYAPRQFITIYGNPFFNTISLKKPGITYHGTHVFHLALGYNYTFAKAYTLGTQVEMFNINAAKHLSQPKLSETNYSFGVFFRVSPSFLIKKF